MTAEGATGASNTYQAPARQVGTRSLSAPDRGVDAAHAGVLTTPRSPASFPCLRCELCTQHL
jgi:hypothetical protein